MGILTKILKSLIKKMLKKEILFSCVVPKAIKRISQILKKLITKL